MPHHDRWQGKGPVFVAKHRSRSRYGERTADVPQPAILWSVGE